jgi:uncharacterized lipoprotein NlpE involved in copper resistance
MYTAHKYYWGHQTRMNDTAGACSRYRETEEVHTELRRGYLRERDHSEDPVVDGKLILT